LATDRLNDATVEFSEALRINPDNVSALNNSAVAAGRKGESG
jgi:Flp pilus assembly protein TadD